MNDNTIVVATTANDNYFQGLCVTVLSAIVSTDPNYRLSFRIFDTGISESNQKLLSKLCKELQSSHEVEFLPITGDYFKGLTADYGGGYSTYARLLMGSLIPESRVIYVDSDFLVMKDLAEAWRQDFGGKIMLATKDYDTPDGQAGRLTDDCPFAPAEDVDDFSYFNCGFLIVDLSAWRSNETEKVAFSQMIGYENCLKAWDQTVLNYVLRGKIGEIDSLWCWSCKIAKIPNSCNIHYISRMKPWNSLAYIPAYKLWYLFHSLFVAQQLPLTISNKLKLKGVFRHIRDYLFFGIGILGDLYVKWIRRRNGNRSAELYDLYLCTSRKAIQEWDWKSLQQIHSCHMKWSQIKNRVD
jgi:lipopolysaccharide biosynthesis glycosyltransferase